jgi:hypothetical protein
MLGLINMLFPVISVGAALLFLLYYVNKVLYYTISGTKPDPKEMDCIQSLIFK